MGVGLGAPDGPQPACQPTCAPAASQTVAALLKIYLLNAFLLGIFLEHMYRTYLSRMRSVMGGGFIMHVHRVLYGMRHLHRHFGRLPDEIP